MGERPALQPRLRAIADLVPAGSRLADIGTDHGYIPIDLLLDGRITAAIATDIGQVPLDHARRTAATYGLSRRVSFRLCDGLTAVSPEEVDTVVIAGMGGETIAAILDAVPWAGEKDLLLQPMTRAELLRPWLAGHNYRIAGETLVEDKGHIYPILRASGGQMPPPDPGQCYYGYASPQDPLFLPYLRRWCRRLERAAAGLQSAEKDPQPQRLEALRAALAALREKEDSLCQP